MERNILGFSDWRHAYRSGGQSVFKQVVLEKASGKKVWMENWGLLNQERDIEGFSRTEMS